MTHHRRHILFERLDTAKSIAVAWNSKSLLLDRKGKGEQAEHARMMSDRWQAFQEKLARRLYY
jgi:hypothetical protein